MEKSKESQDLIDGEVQEALDWFKLEFEGYDFELRVVDLGEEITDSYGEDYLTQVITVKDVYKDLELQVLLSWNGRLLNFHFNSYEDVIEEFKYPSEFWKYFYLSNRS